VILLNTHFLVEFLRAAVVWHTTKKALAFAAADEIRQPSNRSFFLIILKYTNYFRFVTSHRNGTQD
jgi:hypothetical protein